MAGRSAVIFVPDDTAKTGQSYPLMLQRVMGTPLLTWLVQSLELAGIRRFFLVCQDQYQAEAKKCFPQDAVLTTTRDNNPADLLHVFLSTADENEQEVDVVTGPAIYIPAAAVLCDDAGNEENPIGACVCHVSRSALMDALDDTFSFSQFLMDHASAYTSLDGMFSVSSVEDFADWIPILKRMRLLQLARDGVEIWDYDNCYVDLAATIGLGTVLMPGTIIRGKTKIGYGCIIGPNAFIENATIGNHVTVNASHVYGAKIGNAVDIGPYAHIRPGTVLEQHTKIGNFVEVKNSRVGQGTWASHLSYIGDSEVGKNCNLGCSTVTVNYDRVKKHRTTIGDNAFIGCNSSLIAPVTIGAGAYIGAGSTITDDVPPDALGIARARQAIKKDWASKHKK